MTKPQRRQERTVTEEEQYNSLFTTAYVLHAVGLLDPAMLQKLESLDEIGAGNWKECVRQSLGVDAIFVRRAYALATEYMSKPEALVFILRGLHCQEIEQRLEDFGILR